MTSLEDTNSAAKSMQPGQATLQILELLEKLAAAESLAATASAAGENEEQVRTSLRRAAEIIREGQQRKVAAVEERWPLKGSILDWREMSVPEALRMLSDYGIGLDAPAKPSSGDPG